MARRDFKALVDAYIELWNLPDDERRAGIDELFTEDVVYTDPAAVVRGREQLDTYIGLTRKRLGGLRFGAADPVDGHHAQVRFGWRCGDPDGGPAAAGHDFALLDGDRIRAVYGFFE